MISIIKSLKSLLLLSPIALYAALGLGCGGMANLLSSGGSSGATGATPEERQSEESSKVDLGIGGSSNLSGSGNDLAGNLEGGAINAQGADGYHVMAANTSGGGWVGISNDGATTKKALLTAQAVPPSDFLDPLCGKVIGDHSHDNFLGKTPVITVWFGSSPDGPWDHSEHVSALGCGDIGIFCEYYVKDEQGEPQKIKTDYVKLQASYHPRAEDLYYPYTLNPADPTLIDWMKGAQNNLPNLTGDFRSEISPAIHCPSLVLPGRVEVLKLVSYENPMLIAPR